MSETTVSVQLEPERGAFVATHDGKQAGLIAFRRSGDVITAHHTEVGDDFRGVGIGGALFDALVAWARENDTKVVATCPYVVSRFDKFEDARDVLA